MAFKTKPSINKRQKEQARQQRQKEKADRRAQRNEEKKTRGPGAEGEDPDLIGIIPGPQPTNEDEIG